MRMMKRLLWNLLKYETVLAFPDKALAMNTTLSMHVTAGKDTDWLLSGLVDKFNGNRQYA